MSLEKEWVEDFEILENNGVIGINMQLRDEPIDTAALVYDGRNSAILIRNEKKAYILTNLINEVRSKIADSKEILIIESDGEEVVNSYTCSVNMKTQFLKPWVKCWKTSKRRLVMKVVPPWRVNFGELNSLVRK